MIASPESPFSLTSALRFFGRSAALLALILAGLPASAADPALYARIEFVEGEVSIFDARNEPRPARSAGVILAGETIVTGPNGELHARTEDAGFVAFRPNTRVRIDSYLAAGGKDDNVAVSLVTGALRSITGWIGRLNPGGYRIKTANATVGIRGTDHETHYIASSPGGDPGATAPGTYDKVNAGATLLQNNAGQLLINAGQAAHAAHDGKSSPRLLDRAPPIFKPGKNEPRIESRRTELSREIETRLQDRINELRDTHDLKDLKDMKDKIDPDDARRKIIEKRKRRAADK